MRSTITLFLNCIQLPYSLCFISGTYCNWKIQWTKFLTTFPGFLLGNFSCATSGTPGFGIVIWSFFFKIESLETQLNHRWFLVSRSWLLPEGNSGHAEKAPWAKALEGGSPGFHASPLGHCTLQLQLYVAAQHNTGFLWRSEIPFMGGITFKQQRLDSRSMLVQFPSIHCLLGLGRGWGDLGLFWGEERKWENQISVNGAVKNNHDVTTARYSSCPADSSMENKDCWSLSQGFHEGKLKINSFQLNFQWRKWAVLFAVCHWWSWTPRCLNTTLYVGQVVECLNF